jgi:uncharacterized protein (DUF1778 family)
MSTRKTERIVIRCTPEDKQLIKMGAAKQEKPQPVSRYLVSLAYAADFPLTAVKEAAVPILHHLRKVGGNLNQLVHARNKGAAIDRNNLLSVVRRLISVLLHIIPRERLIQMVQETKPCELADSEEEECQS